MNSLVFKTVVVWVIRAVSFYKMNKEHFDQVVDWVREAEVKFEDGMSKSEYVRAKIRATFKIAAPYLQELLLSLAVGYLGKLGPDKGGIYLNNLK